MSIIWVSVIKCRNLKLKKKKEKKKKHSKSNTLKFNISLMNSSKLQKIISILFYLSSILYSLVNSGSTGNLEGENSIVRLFHGCHLKYILPELVNTSAIVTLPFIAQSNLIYSIQTIPGYNENASNTNGSLSECNFPVHHNKIPRYLQCFVHVYYEGGLSLHGKNYSLHERTLDIERCSGEWPHHSIFFGRFGGYSENETRSQQNFYRVQLPQTFARGLIFTLDYDNTKNSTLQAICLSCRTTVKNMNLKALNESIISLGQLEHDAILNPVSAENRGAYLILLINQILDIQQSCEISLPNFRPNYTAAVYSVCALHLLKEKFNFTFHSMQPLPNMTEAAYFAASYSTFVSQWNHNVTTLTRSREWIPYNFQIRPFQFVCFQKQSLLSAATLVKPYDLQSWVLFLVSMMVVVLVMVLTQFHVEVKLAFFILMSLVSSCLEQPVSTNPHERSAAMTFSGLWLLWLFMMIVFSTGYKGIIFSLLTTSSEVSWPASLRELASDSYYIMLSNEMVFRSVNGTRFAVAMLPYFLTDDVMQGKPGKDYPMEYLILNHSRVHSFLNTTVQLMSETIWNNTRHKKRGRYLFGDASATQFAYLHKEPVEFTSLVTYFMPELEASKPVIIPGLERTTPWWISRNFLFQSFDFALAELEQAGFMLAFQRHRERWSTCQSLADVERKLVKDYNFTARRQQSRGCLNKALAGASTGNLVIEPDNVNPLSEEQLIGVFQLMGVAFAACLVIFLVEVVAYILIERVKLFSPPDKTQTGILNIVIYTNEIARAQQIRTLF